MISIQMDRLLETSEIGPFQYGRYAFQSEILNKEMTYGVLVFKDQGSSQQAPGSTVYVLHGANGDDTQTIQAGLLQTLSPQTLEKLRALRAQFVLPLIEGSFLHDHPLERSKSYYEYFCREIMARVERGTSTQPSTRFLVGYSAGGQAALSVFLKDTRHFQGVGAHFPVFPTYDYNSAADTSRYIQRTGADAAYVGIAVQCFKAVFTNDEDLQRHDPLCLAEELSPQQLSKKRIYFDVGTKDEFGLHEGCRSFHEKLFQRDIPHFFEAVPEGKHDVAFLQARFPLLVSYLVS